MSEPVPSNAPRSAHAPAAPAPTIFADPLSCLAELRSAAQGLRTSGVQSQGQFSTSVAAALDQIMAEHQGMADELLSVYEQLGIIFEVTRRLHTVRGEEEVIGLFLESLRRSFHGRDVFVARKRNDSWVRGTVHEGSTSLDSSLAASIAGVCAGPGSRTSVVEVAGQGSSQCQALIGAVYSGDLLFCALVIVRSPGLGGQAATPPFRASDMSLVEALATYCGDLIRNHRLVREMREMSIAMVRSLVSAVDQKDQYTCGHSLRVSYYATTLGRLLRLADLDLQMLQWSALLHDVGKIGIRDEVLNKQGKLTPEEFQHIKEHPDRSHQVVQQVPQLAGALDGIRHHHERYDGSGYPLGLKGEAIPLQARIIQIADVFDALTSSRSYRPAYQWPEALDILKAEAGKTVDPKLQSIFDEYMRRKLQGNADAWNQMVEKANHFASAFGSEESLAAPLNHPVPGDVA